MVFSLIISVGIIIALLTVLVLFSRSFPKREELTEAEVETETPKGFLTSSEILKNKPLYTDQRIIIRGRVSLEPVVCDKKECPTEDTCCGCPSERHLLIFDSGVVVSSKTGGRLKLLNGNGQPFCQRRQGSCEYDCQDWVKGAVYDVRGVFFAEPSPPGWNISLLYYLTVEDKNLVKKINLGEFLLNLYQEFREMLENFKSSGQFVLF